MEQIRNFEWAQDKIDELTKTDGPARHETQRGYSTGWSPTENRAERRERARQERRAAKKAKVKA